MERTRGRITRAAVELHGSIGPAATTMSAVAALAGVTRATLYRYFPNEEKLFSACSADWLAANPRPDAAGWAAIPDPVRRLGAGLEELYAYYRSTEQMRANLLRDIEALPPGIRSGLAALPGSAAGVLEAGWPAHPAARLRRAAIAHAVAFETWRSFARAGLTDHEAVGMMVGLVEAITSSRTRGKTRRNRLVR